MDFDFGDFTEDKIKSFLTDKLDEIHLENQNLESILDQCQKTLKISNEAARMEDTNLIYDTYSCKRIFGGRYALEFVLELKSHSLKDIRLTLEWSSILDFCYTVHIFSRDPIDAKHCDSKCKVLESETVSDGLCGNISVVVTFDIPEFVDKSHYTIYGEICYDIDHNTHVTFPFPETTISTADFRNYKLFDWLHNWNRSLDLDVCITIMFCSNKMEMVMVLPDEQKSSIERIFKTDCSLTAIPSRGIMCKHFFIANKVSSLFDNSLISVHSSETKTYFVNIYTTSDRKLLSFIHYLHTNIKNLVLFPKIYYNSYVTNNSKFSKDLISLLKESITKEIDFVQNSASGINESGSKIENFRQKMCDLERNTDQLYSQICNMNH